MSDSVDSTALPYILTSHSIDNVFDYCPRKFEFLNLHDIRPPRESGYAAQVGTALHEAIQTWLICHAEEKGEQHATEQAYIQLMIHFPWELEKDQSTSVRSFENCVLMLYEMIRSPEWDEWELLYVQDKGWAVEIPFLLKHTSVGPIYIKSRDEYRMLATQGKIDMIMKHRRSGKIRTVDVKTTTLSIQLVRAEWEFSGQQIGYTHVLHGMLGYVPEDFEVVYCVCRFNASEPPTIQFVSIPKTPDQIDDYWIGKLDRLARMKMYAENDWFPRTNGGCHSWGHECQMFDICHSRDANLIRQWFQAIDSQTIQGYDYWVTMEV